MSSAPTLGYSELSQRRRGEIEAPTPISVHEFELRA
jgi:hypothetical protein